MSSAEHDVPKLLYHYASVETARLILSSRKLHATDVRHLTDGFEYSGPLSELQEEVERLDGPNDAKEELQRRLAREYAFVSRRATVDQTPTGGGVFASCFTEVADSARHTKEYAGDSGCMLVFRSAELRSLGQEYKFDLTPVQYDRSVRAVDVHQLAKDALASIDVERGHDGQLCSHGLNDAHANIMFLVRRFASVHKQEHFRWEQEWRLVSRGWGGPIGEPFLDKEGRSRVALEWPAGTSVSAVVASEKDAELLKAYAPVKVRARPF